MLFFSQNTIHGGYYESKNVLFFFVFTCKDDPTSSDSEKPVVSIVSPSYNSEFQEPAVVTIEANASDNETIKKVDFYIDAGLEFTDNTAPYSYEWNTNGKAGTHTLQAKASDDNNNIGISSVLSISIIEANLIDIDGNIYQIIKIGNQWWMVENLKVTHYRNGDAIPNATDNTQWLSLALGDGSGGYCDYRNDSTQVETYGRLYNWHALGDSRKIAPTGWHVPSDEEWKELEMYLGMSQSEADAVEWRGTDEGDKMKDEGVTVWAGRNSGATNESGLSVLPGGWRTDNGDFNAMRVWGIFYSSTSLNNLSCWSRSLKGDSSGVYRIQDNKNYGFSVRCVRD